MIQCKHHLDKPCNCVGCKFAETWTDFAPNDGCTKTDCNAVGVAFDELCTDDVSTDELVTAGLGKINTLVGLAVQLTAAKLKLVE